MSLRNVPQVLSLAQNQCREHCKKHAKNDQQDCKTPIDDKGQRYKNQKGDESSEMLTEEPEPKRPQRVCALKHDLHQAAGMRFAVVGERQLQDVFEIVCQHE